MDIELENYCLINSTQKNNVITKSIIICNDIKFCKLLVLMNCY